MSFKKISFTFTALALVLIAAVLVNITVGGLKQKQAADEDAFYVVIDAGHGELMNTIDLVRNVP